MNYYLSCEVSNISLRKNVVRVREVLKILLVAKSAEAREVQIPLNVFVKKLQ